MSGSKQFPTSVSDSSRPFFGTGGTKGDTGDSAYAVVPQSAIVPIPADNDGANPDYANNTSEIHVFKGLVLQTGWTLAFDSGVNCSGTVNNSVEPRTASITAVTADTGYAIFTATKAGETSLEFRVYFAKVKAGLQGDTGAKGDTGDTGDTGLTGAAGADGVDGKMLVSKQTIDVDAGIDAVFSDGGGNLEAELQSSHSYETDDWVHCWTSDSYEIICQVVNVSGDTITLDASYNSGFTTGRVYDMSKLRTYTGSSYATQAQDVVFRGFMDVDMRLLEWFLVCIASAGATVTITAGKDQYPDADYNAYFSDDCYTIRDSIYEDLRSTSVRLTNTDEDLWLRFDAGAGDWSSTPLSSGEWEFHMAYIDYDITGL